MAHKLKTFLKSLNTIEAKEDFAARCDTTLKHLVNIGYGYKPAGESLCINIERESGGNVRCEDLRSDVDWCVLRNSTPNDQRKIPDRRASRRKPVVK